MRRRRYLEATAGTVLTAITGCLTKNDQTAEPVTSSVRTTGTTTKTTTGAETKQTLSRTTTPEKTTARATETEGAWSSPTASFTLDYTNGEETNEISITHAQGESISGNRVTVTIDETIAFERGDVVTSNYREVTNEWGETVSPDNTLVVQDGKGNEIAKWQTVKIEWTPKNGDDPVLIARFTIQY
jgi:hypothetical protein